MNDEIDVHTRGLLSVLDSEATDPGYWYRFHRWVVDSAAPQLARRRRVAAATVSDVMFSWWRTLVPAALATAAVAAAMLMRGRPTTAPVAYVDVDEILMVGIEAPEMPSFEMASPDGGIVLVNEVF
jgi:anti-sigma-K factor RskA